MWSHKVDCEQARKEAEKRFNEGDIVKAVAGSEKYDEHTSWALYSLFWREMPFLG